jgi:tetratricopeptide (TPR) repeat protein
MFNHNLRLAMVLILASATGGTLVAGPAQFAKGDKVVVMSDAKVIRQGRKEVDEVWPGMVLTIEDVNGQWLWVEHMHAGWLEARYVVPLNRDAAARMTEMIRRNPDDISLYIGRACIWQALGEYDIAIKDYDEVIRLNPFFGYANRGIVRYDSGDYAAAKADFDRAIQLDSTRPFVFNSRSMSHRRLGELDRAIADANSAIRLDPVYVNAYVSRAFAYDKQGQFQRALTDYREILRLNPTNQDALNARAWLRATSLDSGVRDGEQALADALKVCEQTNWCDAQYLDTLAATYAETGDFEQAVAWQTKAISLGEEADRAAYQSRLELYKTGQAYHTEIPALTRAAQ